jgi:transketolase
MQITYTLKNNKAVEQGEYEPDTKVLTMASGRELDLSSESEVKLAKKLIYSKVVTMPDLEMVTLNSLIQR